MRIWCYIALTILGLLVAGDVLAQEVRQPEAIRVQEIVRGWTTAVATSGARVLSDTRLLMWTQFLWMALSIFLVIQTMWSWPTRGIDVPEFVAVVVRVLLVQALMLSYNMITTTIYDGFNGLGGIFQSALIGTDQPFDTVFDLIRMSSMISVQAVESSWWNVFPEVGRTVAVIFISLVQVLFCVFAAGALIWSFLGYSLAKLVGFILVPFLLLKATQKYFDNWLSLFLGFLMYGLLVRLCLVLASMGARWGLGIEPSSVNGVIVQVGSMWDALGLLLFNLLAGVMLLGCSRIAGQLTSSGLAVNDPIGRAASWAGGKFR